MQHLISLIIQFISFLGSAHTNTSFVCCCFRVSRMANSNQRKFNSIK